jgi:hypothetical protein
MRASTFGKTRSPLPVRFPNHGRLTPAALVGVRFHIANVGVFRPDERRAPRAAGVSQPWTINPVAERYRTTAGSRPPLLRMCVSILRQAYVASNVRSCTKSGWREPAVRRGRFGSAKNGGHCRFVTEPRRADARRSCEHAFVHRKNRFFVGGHSHGNTRAGGRKPPRGMRASTFGKTRSPLPVRFPNHGGLTPAALANVCIGTDGVAYVRPDERRAPGLQCACAIRAATVAGPGIALPLPG